VDLGSTCSISPATRRICTIPPVLSAVDVREEGEILTAQSEVVKREWGDRGRI
jgi:hypothetical protein